MNEVIGGDNVFVRCVCVCLSVFLSVCAQRTGQSDQFKTAKAMDFKFEKRVPSDSPDMIGSFKKFSKGGVSRVTRPRKFLGVKY